MIEVPPQKFAPPQKFVDNALIGDCSLYKEADVDFEAFWACQAKEMLTWDTDFHTTLEWSPPFAKWFLGGTLNASYNCVDRHVLSGNGGKVAFYWEGEPGDTRTVTYLDLLEDVQKFASVLRGLGVDKGDRVAIYMPMIPELPVAMLACARIGAAHSVVFGGFSAEAIKERCVDAEARVIVTADAGYRRGQPSLLKPKVDEALSDGVLQVEHVVVVDRCGTDPFMQQGRDLWWHDLMLTANADCPAEPMDSEQLLYLLYTSGTTAKPKGIMHTTGGYLTQAAFTHRYVFDLQTETDVYWCAADIGWVTGHSYIVYGPLLNGCTQVMYEGTPDTPRLNQRGECSASSGRPDRHTWGKGRVWEIIENYGVTQLYMAPTAIRMFMKWGEIWPSSHDLSSLRVLGTVGEPINPEAWLWYHEHIGSGSCPIVDTWWQTETGSHMLSPLPAVTSTKPGSAAHPLPGIFAEVVSGTGEVVKQGVGHLTITKPWPSMLRGIWKDDQRYKRTYWSRYPGRYFTGDGAKVDADGYIWLLGRVDDVMNVSGHRMSTSEIESALVSHDAVAEAAVIGAYDDIKGQAVVAYVVQRDGVRDGARDLEEELQEHVAVRLGPIARPKNVFIVTDLPKTRSGKIMRRLLRDIANDRGLGDVTTLADPRVVSSIRDIVGSRDIVDSQDKVEEPSNEHATEHATRQLSEPANWYRPPFPNVPDGVSRAPGDLCAPGGGTPETLRAPGRAVIFDLDGVVADAGHRQHYLLQKNPDRRSFFMAAEYDTPLRAGLALIQAAIRSSRSTSSRSTAGNCAEVDNCPEVIICTARPHYLTDITRRWLTKYGVHPSLLILREAQDHRDAASFKRYELKRLQRAGYTIELVIEDDEMNIDMYQSEGVFTLYTHSGYYERRKSI